MNLKFHIFHFQPLPSNLKLYHDLKNRAAVTMHTDSDGKVQFVSIFKCPMRMINKI